MRELLKMLYQPSAHRSASAHGVLRPFLKMTELKEQSKNHSSSFVHTSQSTSWLFLLKTNLYNSPGPLGQWRVR